MIIFFLNFNLYSLMYALLTLLLLLLLHTRVNRNPHNETNHVGKTHSLPKSDWSKQISRSFSTKKWVHVTFRGASLSEAPFQWSRVDKGLFSANRGRMQLEDYGFWWFGLFVGGDFWCILLLIEEGIDVIQYRGYLYWYLDNIV